MSASTLPKPKVVFLLHGVVPVKHVHVILQRGETVAEAFNRLGVKVVYQRPGGDRGA